LLGNQSGGSIMIFQIIAIKVKEIAKNTEIHEAVTGLGNFDLYTFNKTLPIQNKAITDKNDIL
jgi:hypothetical protein